MRTCRPRLGNPDFASVGCQLEGLMSRATPRVYASPTLIYALGCPVAAGTVPCRRHAKRYCDLRAALSCAADLSRTIALESFPDPELKKVASEYRSTVEQLARILPLVYGRLMMEKARLQIAQAHVTATAAWAQASHNTV